jgi:hypothetical protein
MKSNTISTNCKAENSELCSTINAVKYFHTPQTESLVNVINNLPSPNIKNSMFKLLKCPAIAEDLFNTAFTKYQYFSLNILMRFFETDIIFPFHYFW